MPGQPDPDSKSNSQPSIGSFHRARTSSLAGSTDTSRGPTPLEQVIHDGSRSTGTGLIRYRKACCVGPGQPTFRSIGPRSATTHNRRLSTAPGVALVSTPPWPPGADLREAPNGESSTKVYRSSSLSGKDRRPRRRVHARPSAPLSSSRSATSAGLRNYCARKGILYLCTPWDPTSARVLLDLGVCAFKVASADLTKPASPRRPLPPRSVR